LSDALRLRKSTKLIARWAKPPESYSVDLSHQPALSLKFLVESLLDIMRNVPHYA
jgi:hypothetical protein